MTNAQKWVAAFLVLFIMLFGLSRLFKSEDTDLENVDTYFDDEEYATKEVSQIMDDLSCYDCHGDKLEGTDLGPSLIGVGKYWNRSELINYFRNPSSYRGDDRFDEYRKKYQMDMTSFNEIDVKILGRIADRVLELK